MLFAFSEDFVSVLIAHEVEAYADRENLRKGTVFYRIKKITQILEKIEDEKWLSDLCSLQVIDRKEGNDEIHLKLSKHESNYFISLFAKNCAAGNFVSLTAYELEEDLAKKVIVVYPRTKHYLQPQIKEIEKAFKLEPATVDDANDIAYEALNYVMLPSFLLL